MWVFIIGSDDCDIDPLRPDGIGMSLRGEVSRRYSWLRHSLLVNRLFGSYRSKSRMHCISERGTLLSNRSKKSFGGVLG